MVAIGVTLQPEQRYLELVTPLAVELADYVEVAPETLWRVDDDGSLAPNGYHALLRELRARHRLAVVAHGTGLSLGSADPVDELRLKRWLERIASDHALFQFGWYTDHLGPNMLAGRSMMLPMAMPLVPETADLVRARLEALQQVVPDVGFENTVHYFLLGDWLDEPVWMTRALPASRGWLVLDVHNAWTTGLNLHIDPRRWLDGLDFARVIEIHLSGGSDSDPAWLPDRSTMRLDSHDDAVPEPVWSLLEEVLPRCINLRGITLERMEGAVAPHDVATLRRELERLREVADAHA